MIRHITAYSHLYHTLRHSSPTARIPMMLTALFVTLLPSYAWADGGCGGSFESWPCFLLSAVVLGVPSIPAGLGAIVAIALLVRRSKTPFPLFLTTGLILLALATAPFHFAAFLALFDEGVTFSFLVLITALSHTGLFGVLTFLTTQILPGHTQEDTKYV